MPAPHLSQKQVFKVSGVSVGMGVSGSWSVPRKQRGVSLRHPQLLLPIRARSWPASPEPPREFLCIPFAKMVFWLLFIILIQKRG